MVGWSPIDDVFGLEHCVGDQLSSVFVNEAVEHTGSLLAGLNDLAPTQLREMLGHRGGRLPDLFGEFPHGKFPVAQRQNYSDPGGIGQQRKHLRREIDVLALDPKPANLLIFAHTNILGAGSETKQTFPGFAHALRIPHGSFRLSARLLSAK